MIVSIDVNLDGLRLLILSADCYSQEFTDALSKYHDAEGQVIFNKKTELQVLLTNLKRLSILILSMTETLQVSDNSDEIIDDIHHTAVINLGFSEQALRVLAFSKR